MLGCGVGMNAFPATRVELAFDDNQRVALQGQPTGVTDLARHRSRHITALTEVEALESTQEDADDVCRNFLLCPRLTECAVGQETAAICCLDDLEDHQVANDATDQHVLQVT